MAKKLKTIDELVGERVAVYLNLHRGCFSVQKDGLVVAYTDEIHLIDVEFRVSEAGRQRVLAEQCKNVHAKVWGTVQHEVCGLSWDQVYYNPYEVETFVKGDEPIYEANACVLTGGKVWV